ncbi:hypothetical protein QBC34DRAFT_124747 [Podospora aff. communis PSN243]|uniref:DUF6536 domain-containing protein n=1 Tax=Podospora aff. communis PSN243 TaxID=3040156 RepID=A0AAV9GIC7_9PEZI|nr:hypothetical protein QBC34DRAFT_124747 [Podospora aff. communis PSN243]
MPWRNRVLWILFAISSIPLALMFNSVIIQTQASTDCLIVFAGESFLHGAYGSLPGAGDDMPMMSKFVDSEATLREISKSVSGPTSPQRWERLGLDECVDRYGQRNSVLANYRHAIMVLGYANGSSAQAGWPVAQVRRRFNDEKIENYRSVVNHVWMARPLVRTDSPVGKDNTLALSTDLTAAILMPPSSVKGVDLEMGLLTMDPTMINEPYRSMRAEYCLSERIEIPCRVEVENTLLLAVCVMCGFKTLLCVVVLIIYGGKAESPLATTGDTIESFIVQPDPHTNGVCSLSRVDLASTSKVQDRVSWGSMAMAKQWKTLRRGAGQAVPISVWVFSYILIGCSLIVLTVLSSLATQNTELNASQFGHDPEDQQLLRDKGLTLIPAMLLANTPQLVLSMCYMVYNGLFTRMLAEFEWASFSVRAKPLRTSNGRGQQRSSYRLQLPYRFSIPLIVVSWLLHWLYSNAIYVSIYEGHRWYAPYPHFDLSEGLQFSVVATVVSLAVSIFIAVLPIGLAWVKLPGDMVVAGGNSMVISAACHVVTPSMVTDDEGSEREEKTGIDREGPEALVMGRLKWGEIPTPMQMLSGKPTNHLAFGSEHQDITKPVEGRWYASSAGFRS